MDLSMQTKCKVRSHPLFLAGFRPFFILAIVSGVFLPLLWALSFSGKVNLSFAGISTLQWHAHEMFFGFGWAVLGGFLLTASKNWVKIRGMHGGWLFLATLLWFIERIAILFYKNIPFGLSFVAVNSFILFVAAYIIWSLVHYRKQDSFRDNFFFIIALPLFIVAKNLILDEDLYIYGWTMTIGLFRLAFVVMFERTITQFMKNSMGVELVRNPILDYSIKFFVLLSVFSGFFTTGLAFGVLLLAGILLGLRFLLWAPLKGLSTFAIGLSYFGYLALIVHMILEALRVKGLLPAVGTVSIHVFTFLCMGIVIPAMFIRICQGHTGRKLLFTTSDRIAIAFMGSASVFRLMLPQIWPEYYLNWILFAGVGWSLCFIMIGYRLIPFLVKPRIDGKEH